jgi:hypothetical protein
MSTPASVPTVESVEAAVSTTGVNFKDPVQLLGYAMKVIKELGALSSLSTDAQSAAIVAAVKHAVQTSSLTADEQTIALAWCDTALPHIVQAVALVKADVAKVETVALAEVQKCCPSFFTKKV